MLFDRPSHDPLPDKPGFEDVKYAAGKGLVSLVPGLGEVWGIVWTAPLEQRRNDWFSDLERRLREMENQIAGFRFENLGQNEAFVSAVTQATQEAMRTDEKEKLEALRNAVLNVAAGTAPSADKRAFFSEWVVKFKPLHLRLLAFMDEPKKYGATWVSHKMGSTSVYEVIYSVFPELAGQFQLINVAVRDLHAAGLIAADIEHAMKPAPPYSKWATFQGEEFLRFIREPELSKAGATL